MQKQYDDFAKMKPKEMSKAISDMTYTYINPETEKPTVVPPQHYEKILSRVKEQYIDEITRVQILNVIYTQLKSLKEENPVAFDKALLCLDLGLKPNDLRVNEQIALGMTLEMMQEKEAKEKKNYHFMNNDFVDFFKDTKDSPEVQAEVIRQNNELEACEIEEDRDDFTLEMN